jgi:hypothetical protein
MADPQDLPRNPASPMRVRVPGRRPLKVTILNREGRSPIMSFRVGTTSKTRLPVELRITHEMCKYGCDGPALRDGGAVVDTKEPTMLCLRLAPAPVRLDEHAKRVNRPGAGSQ